MRVIHPLPRRLRRVIAVLAGAMLLCAVLVDRPVATYMHDAVYSTVLFDWAMGIFPVLLWAGGCGPAMLAGGRRASA